MSIKCWYNYIMCGFLRRLEKLLIPWDGYCAPCSDCNECEIHGKPCKNL